jgi:hypothetical protein
MKRLITLLLAATMALSLCACGKKTTTNTTTTDDDTTTVTDTTVSTGTEDGSDVATPDEITNPGEASLSKPAQASTYEDILAMGFDLQAPENAEDTAYYYYNTDPTMVEMTFTLDGDYYIYRAAGTDEYEDLSGLFYSGWNIADEALVFGDTVAYLNITDEADMPTGCITWYDDTENASFSLCMPYTADATKLATLVSQFSGLELTVPEETTYVDDTEGETVELTPDTSVAG